ncbi:UNVERIFIED_ORG: hypothetical protein FHR35_007204 [Microbispora rosea subsp. rosea]
MSTVRKGLSLSAGSGSVRRQPEIPARHRPPSGAFQADEPPTDGPERHPDRG